MARISVQDSDVVVGLSTLEKLGAFHGDFRLPLSSIVSCRVPREPWTELRGMRAPGTGIPGVIALGTRRGGGIRDFAAVYRQVPVVVLETNGASFDRVVLSLENADQVAASIDQHMRSGNEQ